MEPFQIGNILITQERVAHLDQSRVVASILRENFRNGEITVVRVCPSPYILSLLALGMIVVGLLTARGLIEWLSYGGTVYDVSIMMILFLPAGRGCFIKHGVALQCFSSKQTRAPFGWNLEARARRRPSPPSSAPPKSEDTRCGVAPAHIHECVEGGCCPEPPNKALQTGAAARLDCRFIGLALSPLAAERHDR